MNPADQLDEPRTRIGGVEIQYYYTCHRELWFKLQQISPPQDDSHLTAGRIINKRSYPNRSRREVTIGSAKIDMVISGKSPKLVEIKKSSKLLLPTTRQLQYYLWLLEEQGISIRGEIRVPREKRVVPVSLDPKARKEIREAISAIEKIATAERPPPYRRKPYCTKCAYRLLCEA